MSEPTKITPEELAELQGLQKQADDLSAKLQQVQTIQNYCMSKVIQKYGIQGPFLIELDGTITPKDPMTPES